MEQQKNEVLPGALNLMVLKTLSALGPPHEYGIARRIERTSGNYYSITRAWKKQLAAEEETWRRASEIMIRFPESSEENT